MKTAQVDLVWSYPASRKPDGRLVCDNGGDIDWWFRQSMRLSIPDTVTAQDVKELGYVHELAYWLQSDWEPIGDSEDGKEYHDDMSVVLTADDSEKVDVEFTFAEDGTLTIKDEDLRWEVEGKYEEDEEVGLLDPWQQETWAKQQPVQEEP